MKYYSTNQQSPLVDFKEATIRGQAPDKGLYFPATIPAIKPELISRLSQYSEEDIAMEVIQPFVGDTIPEKELRTIVEETINFPIPLVNVSDTISSLELYHGPTLAFKDIGARFMSRCLGYFVKGESRKVTVLVATSGDTGGAVANGFYDIDGVEVVLLYPSGKVSPVQEKQLTTLGKNIHALEVTGTFDDCQSMVKQAFMDPELSRKLFLTSANSINVARWLPQQFYYFFALRQWKPKEPPVISVPSGNFGNICAGMLAHHAGLPVKHFIAACNANEIISSYFSSGVMQPRSTIATISNAMDVGNPSNFVRILEIFQQQLPSLKNKLTAYSITDADTVTTIQKVYQQFNYVLDPHGAVGFAALDKYLGDHPGDKGFILETAHPVKFPDAVEGAIHRALDIPDTVKSIMNEEKKSQLIRPEYDELRSYLLEAKR